MVTIYKYPLTSSEDIVYLHEGYKILDAQYQNDKIVLWAVVDTYKPRSVKVLVSSFNTGVELDELAKYVSTIQVGKIVWHIFIKELARELH